MASVEELEAQLAAAKAVEGDVVDGNGGVYLTIRDEQFECRRVNVSWYIMKFARAQRKAQINIPKNMPQGPMRTELEEKRNSAGIELMAIMLDTVNCLLKPHERDRFENYMDTISETGLEPGELENAIGNVIAAVGGNEEGKADRSSDSLDSQQTTSESVRVISLSKATHADALPAKS